MKSFVKEFKEFALRGNVVDLTIGIVVGGAFTKVMNSLVTDIIMPVLSIFIGSIEITDLSFAVKQIGGDVTVNIRYGVLLNVIINFIIIALAVFIAIKAVNKLKRTTPNKEDIEREELLLLREIRDSLQGKDNGTSI